MSELTSVGLDVGTTSTQMVVSQLTVENRAGAWAVPEFAISRRRVLYRSPVYFTPLLNEQLMDAPALRSLVEKEYRAAGITREMVDTGAVLITGETSRRENARAVGEALGDLAGDFVVTAAGPELESVLAAKGAGAVEFSRETGKTVLHMDIGGGTSNLCLIRAGEIVDTGCLNVGGRLIKFDGGGILRYVSPVLEGLFSGRAGEPITEEAALALAETLGEALEMAAGLRPATELLQKLATAEVGRLWQPPEPGAVLSFSGGVADCVEKDVPWETYGDLGPLLGRVIRQGRLCRGEHRLGTETIRATVIGAGCHSTQLSGSTVYYRNLAFPLKNIPAAAIKTPADIPGAQAQGPAVLTLPGLPSPGYAQVASLADSIAQNASGPVYLCLEADMAKALGQALALRLPEDVPILCIDGIHVPPGSCLDIGAPVGSALPVVVKTLVFGGNT